MLHHTGCRCLLPEEGRPNQRSRQLLKRMPPLTLSSHKRERREGLPVLCFESLVRAHHYCRQQKGGARLAARSTQPPPPPLTPSFGHRRKQACSKDYRRSNRNESERSTRPLESPRQGLSDATPRPPRRIVLRNHTGRGHRVPLLSTAPKPSRVREDPTMRLA